MLRARKKNLKMRHIALAMFAVILTFASSSHAQMTVQTLKPIVAAYPIDMNDPASPMRDLGYLPPGALLSMQVPWSILNNQQTINIQYSLEQWMRSIGSDPYPGGGNLAYIPASIENSVPGFTAGQSVFVPMNQLIAQDYVRLMEEERSRIIKDDDDDDNESEAVCTECDTDREIIRQERELRNLQKVAAKALAPSTASSNIRFTPMPIGGAKRAMAAKCDNLMNDKTGEMGPWGKIVASTLTNEKNKNQFLKNNALGAFCPRFNQLSEEKRVQAWVWFWTSLAQEESHCEPKIMHGLDINPRTGYGIWTMEYSSTIRANRGPECANIGGKNKSDEENIRGQAACALSIMRKTQLEDGHSAHQYRSSYWGPTRPRWYFTHPKSKKTIELGAPKQMMPHMKRFSECF